MKKLVPTLALALLSSGCIGTNAAFNGIRDWNEGVSEDRWGRAIVHAAFWVVPVYELALLGDVLIFNTIEFWSRENPIEKEA